MKKFLLSLASAALLAVPAFAQQLTMSPLTTGNRSLVTNNAPISKSINLNNQIFASVPMMQNRQSRVAEDVRPHQLLSYATSLEQLQVLNLGPLPITFSDLSASGLSGYGFAQLYLNDLLSRYAGNTISSIEFCCSMGKYSNGMAFIINAGTGEMVWSAQVDQIEGMTPTPDGGFNVPSNEVACDYVITGDEPALYIGWVADCQPDPNFPIAQYKDNLIMPMHTDATGQGLGAAMLIKNAEGKIGIYDNYPSWSTDRGEMEVNCAYIVVNTEGENGVKDNDAQVADVATIRVEKASGIGSNAKVSVMNLGLDPIDSFDYKFEAGGVVKEGTCVLEDLLPYYNFTSVNLAAAYPDLAGRADGTFTITKVNEVPDENIENEDNEAKYEALVFDKGYRRMPVVETFTSSHCVYCPVVGPSLSKIDKAVNGHFIPLNVHVDMGPDQKDPLHANDLYLDIHSRYNPANGAIPASMINREVSGDPYWAAPLAVENINKSICEANMKLTVGKALNPLVPTFEVSTDLTFTFDVQAGAYSIAYVITEDGVTGVQQVNAYAALFAQFVAQNPGISEDIIFDAMTEQIGYDFSNDENLRNICKMGTPSASGAYVYNPVYTDVACTITDVKDASFTLPVIKNGQTFTHTAKLSAPTRTSPKVKRDNLSVTALLIDKKSGTIVTAARAKMGETSVESGIEKIENVSKVQIEAANGAFQVVAENAVAEVYSMDGKLVSSATVKGSASLPTFGKGVFVIRVVEGKNVTSKKAVF